MLLPERRAAECDEMLRTFCCFIPKVRLCVCGGGGEGGVQQDLYVGFALHHVPPLTLQCHCCLPPGSPTPTPRPPQARAPPAEVWVSHPDWSLVAAAARRAQALTQTYCQRSALLHTAAIRTRLFFPDRRLIQYDCGKLQVGAVSHHI